LSNEIRISLVCFGVNEAREAISGDVQLARWFEEFPQPRWSAEEGFEQLVLAISHRSDRPNRQEVSRRPFAEVAGVAERPAAARDVPGCINQGTFSSFIGRSATNLGAHLDLARPQGRLCHQPRRTTGRLRRSIF